MPNTILTPTAVTRKALQILHQKLNFVGNVNRQYDSSFAQSGAKIGDSLKIRLPNEYTVATGADIALQEIAESSTTIQVATQKHVDFTFPTAELTLSIDDFSERFLEPAMSVLAANVEADALSMYKDVPNVVDGDAAAFSFASMSNATAMLTKNLAPSSQRSMTMNPDHANKFRVDTKGLFQDSGNIAKQYREGMIGRTSGFDVYENTLLVPHQTGTAAKTTGYVINTSTGITSGTATITVSGGTTTFLKGDVITIADVFRVHPETKVSTGELQQFVVTADSGASATSLAVFPAPTTSGARQNVTLVSAGASKAIVKIGAGANETLVQSLAFHRNAFAFVTADLEDVSQYGAWGAREVFDGISLRVARQYAIGTDTVPCRIDVLYGYKAIRPQLAARVHYDA